MSVHLDPVALLAAARAGQGTIVVVEGEHSNEDQYYYTRWFGNIATQVSFFAQNGWVKVTSAVADLRMQLQNRKIFGIIDRDFAPLALLASQSTSLPADGILRTQKYTVENYLLEAVGWLSVVRTLMRGAPPPPYASVSEIETRIQEAYVACLELAARNRVIHDEHLRVPTGGIPYREHPDALRGNPPERELLTWEGQRPTPPPKSLVAAYLEHLADLRAASLAVLEETVTAKAALKVFLQRLKQTVAMSVADDILISMYIDAHTTPPSDLQILINRLL
jgi:hypothetical protein